MLKSSSDTTKAPAGIRRNNPGNLRYSEANNWRGQVGQENGFSVFESMPYGVRAAAINLRSYINSGTNTLEKIVHRWAPSHENPTENYLAYLERRTGIARHTPLVYSGTTAAKILPAIFYFENGQEVPAADIQRGLELVG